MIKGLYVSKAGMLSRQRQLEVNANNLANMSTVGFKKNEVFFRHLLDASQATDAKKMDESFAAGSEITDFSTGSIQETGNPLDLAIAGEGFFVIGTPRGEVYSRNGNFSLDTDGRLVTQDGFPVLGSGGEIQLAGNDVKVNENGDITVEDRVVDKIKIVQFEDPTLLTKIGGTYFTDEDQAMVYDLPPEKIQLRQGYLEGSNVSGMDEVVQMIELYQQFELAQKAISSQDHTLDRLINDAGRVQ